MLEAQLSESMVGTLNDYLDKLMVDEKRKSHAGTLVGQIGHGQQLTMDHLCEEMKDFNTMIQGLAMDYVKQFCAASGNPLSGNREVITDELYKLYSEVPAVGKSKICCGTFVHVVQETPIIVLVP